MNRRKKSQLKKSLNRYAAQASVTVADKTKLRRWATYAAVAGAAGAMETRVEAAVIYSGVQNLTAELLNPTLTSGLSDQSLNINLDGAGSNDIGMFVRRFQFITSSGYSNAVSDHYARLNYGNRRAAITYPNFPLNLPPGAPISAGGPWFTGPSPLLKLNGAGNFPKGVAGLLGVRFFNGPDTHFGWVRLQLDDVAAGIGLGPDKITVIDWAYEGTSGATILAGAVPEPGTASLALLAGGFMGVAAYRRRRKQEAQKTEQVTSE
jgi:hypothetical protein